MVTKAIDQANWRRASYLELNAPRQPQSIGQLMSEVLARHALKLPVAMEERDYDDEDSHTLAASTAT